MRFADDFWRRVRWIQVPNRNHDAPKHLIVVDVEPKVVIKLYEGVDVEVGFFLQLNKHNNTVKN